MRVTDIVGGCACKGGTLIERTWLSLLVFPPRWCMAPYYFSTLFRFYRMMYRNIASVTPFVRLSSPVPVRGPWFCPLLGIPATGCSCFNVFVMIIRNYGVSPRPRVGDPGRCGLSPYRHELVMRSGVHVVYSAFLWRESPSTCVGPGLPWCKSLPT